MGSVYFGFCDYELVIDLCLASFILCQFINLRFVRCLFDRAGAASVSDSKTEISLTRRIQNPAGA